MRRKLVIVVALLLLNGCASMSSEDCANADWRALGYQDGARGDTLQRASKRGQDCAKHGFQMNHDTYNEGRNQGLVAYCTSARAYSLGESGKKYNGVCVNHKESEFLAAYDSGYELYRFTAAVELGKTKLREAQQKYDRLNEEIQKYTNGFREESLSAAEHNEHVLDVWAERKWLQQEAIPHWTVEQRFAERELEDYRRKVANNAPALGTLRPSPMKQLDPFPGASKADAAEMMAEVFGKYGQSK